MKFKATLEDSHTFLGVLQVCRSIQKDCIIRLHSTRIRFFTTIEAFDGVHVWIGCRTSHLFHDFRCVSPYNEQSITCEILDISQLYHIIKQADTRERRSNPSLSYNSNNNDNNDYYTNTYSNNNEQQQRQGASRTVIRLARSGEQPIWKITMQGQTGMPDLSYDVPVRILSDNELAQMNAPPLEEHRIQIVLPHLQELTLFIEKLKLTSCETVTFDALVMQEISTMIKTAGGEHDEDEDNVDEQLRDNYEQEERKEEVNYCRSNTEENETGNVNGEVEEVMPINVVKPNCNKDSINAVNNNKDCCNSNATDIERGYYKRNRANEEDNAQPMHTKLVIRAEHAFAEFVLEYDNVELLEHPKVSTLVNNVHDKSIKDCTNANQHKNKNNNGDEEEQQQQEYDRKSAQVHEDKMAVANGEQLIYRAEVSVDVRKFARFFSAVKEVAPTRVSMYLVHRRALVLSVYGSNSTTMVAYIPVKI